MSERVYRGRILRARRRMPDEKTELKRALGVPSLTFYGTGLILGAGIYSILGAAAGEAGDALWWSFVLAAAVALLTAFSYAELSTMMPHAGAEYVYLRAAFPGARWLAATIGYILTVSVSAMGATVAIAFASYGRDLLPWPSWIVAGALILLVAVVNAWGVQQSGRANMVLTLIEGGGLVLVVAVGMMQPDVWAPLATAPHMGVLAGASIVFFAFLGFEELANLAEEARRPGRTLPLAIFLSLGISTLLYVLTALAAVTLLDPADLAASHAPLADAVGQRSSRLAGALGGIALFATANTCLINVLAASRLLYGMARRGEAPPVVARVTPQRRSPVVAILVVTALSLAFLPLGTSEAVGRVSSLAALVAFATVHVTLLRLRKVKPRQERPFRVPGGKYPVLAILGLASAGLLMFQFDAVTYVIFAVAVALSLGVAFWRSRRPRPA